MKTFFYYWVPLFLYAGVIFVLSSLPTDSRVEFIPHSDKVAHVVEYTIFALLLCRALRTCFTSPLSIALLVFVVTLMYGVLDEYHQTFVPTRRADLFDVVADGIGATAALLLYPISIRRPSSTSSS